MLSIICGQIDKSELKVSDFGEDPYDKADEMSFSIIWEKDDLYITLGREEVEQLRDFLTEQLNNLK